MFTYVEREYSITKIEDLKHIHIKGYIQYLISLQRKETYINGLIKSFRAFFKYCVEEEYIATNPALKLSFQREETPMILTFTDDEVVRMVNYYKGTKFLTVRNKLIMIILFDTGVRNSELCNIKMEDLRENAISIYGKGKPLTKATIEKVVKDCKIPCKIRQEIRCSPHTCRHYYAQKQLRNGCDVYTVSRLLGHQNIMITKRYLQSIQDQDILNIGMKTSPLIALKIK